MALHPESEKKVKMRFVAVAEIEIFDKLMIKESEKQVLKRPEMRTCLAEEGRSPEEKIESGRGPKGSKHAQAAVQGVPEKTTFLKFLGLFECPVVMDVPFSNKFLMPCCIGCSSDDDYDDFGHFIFKAHFENFLEFLDSPTPEVNSKTPRCRSNETSLNVLRIFVTKLQPFS